MSGPRAWGRTLPALVGVLLVLCAALVIVGASIERGGETEAGAGSAELAESGESGHAESDAEPARGEAAEKDGVLGVPIESPLALIGLAVISVGLAALIWRRPTRLVASGVLVFTVAAGALDLAEVSHSRDRIGLAILAGLILLLRVATGASAVAVWRAAASGMSSRSAP